MSQLGRGASIEVAIPCLNEAKTIGKVVRDFQQVLPEARVVVYDNGSADETIRIARQAGAEVRKVNRLGKGFVTQAVFEQSTADIVLMVDGDDTYDAASAPRLLDPLLSGDADMTIGTRLETLDGQSFRRFHRFGNVMITGIINLVFRASFRDLLSGYRGITRRFMESVPLITCGFETETELIVQSIQQGFVVYEIPTPYRSRPQGSTSKLRTLRDGYRIILTIMVLLRDHRPMLVFGSSACLLGTIGLTLWAAGMTVNPHLRAAGVLVGGLAFALLLTGLVLNTINTRFREVQSLLRRPREGRRIEPSEAWLSEPRQTDEADPLSEDAPV